MNKELENENEMVEFINFCMKLAGEIASAFEYYLDFSTGDDIPKPITKLFIQIEEGVYTQDRYKVLGNFLVEFVEAYFEDYKKIKNKKRGGGLVRTEIPGIIRWEEGVGYE